MRLIVPPHSPASFLFPLSCSLFFLFFFFSLCQIGFTFKAFEQGTAWKFSSTSPCHTSSYAGRRSALGRPSLWPPCRTVLPPSLSLSLATPVPLSATTASNFKKRSGPRPLHMNQARQRHGREFQGEPSILVLGFHYFFLYIFSLHVTHPPCILSSWPPSSRTAGISVRLPGCSWARLNFFMVRCAWFVLVFFLVKFILFLFFGWREESRQGVCLCGARELFVILFFAIPFFIRVYAALL